VNIEALVWMLAALSLALSMGCAIQYREIARLTEERDRLWENWQVTARELAKTQGKEGSSREHPRLV
jgi:hypothetical protein